ncbi:mitochondrial ATPase inhibitor, IATP-domain-containing protein [Lineolata rhizophorae]|uniref:ATPase inhibitor, mitochondrial n=1 Tax=Lineolata rhizophorae TaxID=578093 RepID=A0A6A6NS73_9PEZI|nr:mitochondrial ATPase inhibitor, IATP-domain-containing protein [Lineolata rhizophorae]
MLRAASVARAFSPVVASRRALSTSARLMSAGDTGSGFSRPGGERSGDAYTRREKANEDLYIKEEEKRKLMQLKEKITAQRKHMDELEKHIDDLTKEQGGEQH